VSCVARAKIVLSPGGRAVTNEVHALTINNDSPIELRCDRPRLLLKIGMKYEIIRNERSPEAGMWRVSTRAYMYEIQTASGELVWSYHWHPTSRVQSPHAHIGSTQLARNAVLSNKAHYPTGRISLESVVRNLITDYGVTPMREDWVKTLEIRETDFEAYRSWS
jgi:hypothetical protein